MRALLFSVIFRYLEGRELLPGDGVYITSTLEPDGQLVSLELTDLKLDDAGQVKVVAVNSEGDASSAAQLTVIGQTICLWYNNGNNDC